LKEESDPLLLDAGGGTGRLGVLLAANGYNIIIVDVS